MTDSPDTLIPVGRYLDPAEAQMARGLLESEGIDCVLNGTNSNAIMSMTFRVRLQVRQRDEARARLLLEEAEFTELD
jgi:hypothetical protein